MRKEIKEWVVVVLLFGLVVLCFKAASLHAEALPLVNGPLVPAPLCAGVQCIEVK